MRDTHRNSNIRVFKFKILSMYLYYNLHEGYIMITINIYDIHC